jgi:plastocyanin
MKKSIVSKSRFLLRIIFLFAILSTAYNCSKDTMNDMSGSTGNPGGTGPGANEVWMQGSVFNPETITVTAGTTIKWINKDGVIHTVTSNTGLFDSGNVAANGTYSLKFANSGTFQYHCILHLPMTGKVVVN